VRCAVCVCGILYTTSYWDKCKRKNPDHMAEFLHPADLVAEAVQDAAATITGDDDEDGVDAAPPAAAPISGMFAHACVCLRA
jgi:hypothetical protein